MLVRQGYSHDPPSPWGMWLYLGILKPRSFTRPVLENGVLVRDSRSSTDSSLFEPAPRSLDVYETLGRRCVCAVCACVFIRS